MSFFYGSSGLFLTATALALGGQSLFSGNVLKMSSMDQKRDSLMPVDVRMFG